MAEGRVRVVQITSAHRALDARIFHKISKTLVRYGYEVVLVAGHQQDETIDGIRIAAVPKPRGRLRRMTVNLYRIYRKTRELDGDIYHFHDPELMPIGLLLKLHGKRVIYDAHEDLPRTVSYKEYVPRALRPLVAKMVEHLELVGARRLTAVIGASTPIAERFRSVNPNTAVVQNFPILDELSPKQQPAWHERKPTIAYIGVISRERGVFELLDAMSQLQPRLECRLALAGWFSEAGLRKEIQELPASRFVDCLGTLSRAQVADLLAEVQIGIVVLHPESNFLNGKPTKLFEYMCAGIPVVASDFPVWREIVETARCGLLVDPLKPNQIAEAIEHLLTHPKEAEEMGRRGRAVAEASFNWKTEERTLLGLYESILLHQQPGAPENVHA